MEAYKQTIAYENSPIMIKAQALAEGELTPPPSLPPIASVLSVSGQATSSALPQDGVFLCSGAVTLCVVYVCSNGRLHGFDSVAVFKHGVEHNQAESSMLCSVSATVGEITYRLSGGALSVRAPVEMNILARSNGRLEAIEKVSDSQTRFDNLDTCVVQSQIDELSIREEARLPRVAQKLLCLTGYARPSKVTIENGKAYTDGIIKLEALFTAPDGTLVQTPISLPFSNIMAVSTDGRPSARIRILSLSGMLADEDVISIEATLEITVTVVSQRRHTILDDAYGTSDELTCEKTPIGVVEANNCACRTTLRLSAPLPSGMPQADRTLAVLCKANIPTAVAKQHTILAEGNMDCSIIYLCSEGNLHGFTARLPFEAQLEAMGMPDTNNLLLDADCELIYAGANNAELPLQISLDVYAVGWTQKDVEVVTGIQASEREALPEGPMVYFPSSGESMWDVGKRFGLTLDQIKKHNPSGQGPVLLNL